MQVQCTSSWNDIYKSFPYEKKDIYYFEEYVKLYQGKDGEAECVICQENDKIMILPYIKKEYKGYYDFETPYGYGGPISNCDDTNWNSLAIDEIWKCLKEKDFLCGFFRFHPLLQNYVLCEEKMQVYFDRHTVAIDTSMSEEEIWKNEIKSKNRNMIRKAEKNGFVYEADYDFSRLEEFINLYNATMERLEAEDFYFFDQSYYENLKGALHNKGFLGLVLHENKVVCGAIFMYEGNYGHYHLEGSDRKYASYGINNFLLWKTACELHNLGIEKFHLGGGYNAEPDNSLLSFKKGFSRDLQDFYIGKKIFNDEAYQKICLEWEKNNPDKAEKYKNFLLRYRY